MKRNRKWLKHWTTFLFVLAIVCSLGFSVWRPEAYAQEATSLSAQEAYVNLMKRLIDQYGIYPINPEGIPYPQERSAAAVALSAETGIFSAKIVDLDEDGLDELVVVRLENLLQDMVIADQDQAAVYPPEKSLVLTIYSFTGSEPELLFNEPIVRRFDGQRSHLSARLLPTGGITRLYLETNQFYNGGVFCLYSALSKQGSRMAVDSMLLYDFWGESEAAAYRVPVDSFEAFRSEQYVASPLRYGQLSPDASESLEDALAEIGLVLQEPMTAGVSILDQHLANGPQTAISGSQEEFLRVEFAADLQKNCYYALYSTWDDTMSLTGQQVGIDANDMLAILNDIK